MTGLYGIGDRDILFGNLFRYGAAGVSDFRLLVEKTE